MGAMGSISDPSVPLPTVSCFLTGLREVAEVLQLLPDEELARVLPHLTQLDFPDVIALLAFQSSVPGGSEFCPEIMADGESQRPTFGGGGGTPPSALVGGPIPPPPLPLFPGSIFCQCVPLFFCGC